MKIFPFLLVVALAFSHCKKDMSTVEQPRIPRDDSKDFLQEIISDPPAEYFISGEFDGKPIYFASTHAAQYPYHDTIFNAIYVYNDVKGDNIHMLRRDDAQRAQIALYFSDAFLSERKMPYKPIGFPTESSLGIAELELINLARVGRGIGQNSPNDNFSFVGYTSLYVDVVVNSFEDGIAERTFQGPIKANTGPVIEVKNGKFRLKLITVRQDIRDK